MASAPIAPSVLRASVVWAFLCVPALAQSPEELLAAGGKLMDTNEYVRAIDTYNAIPDTAPGQIRLTKHINITMSLMNLGRMDEALDQLERSQRVADEIGTNIAWARVENARGRLQTDLGEGDRGLGALHQALDLLGNGDPRTLATIYDNLSSAYQDLEDWERQMYFRQKSFDLRTNPTLVQRFNHAISTGIAHYELYDRDAAEAQFKIGLDLARQLGGKRNESFALGELAFTYWTFDRDAGRSLALSDEAIALAAEARTTTLESNWLTNRGNVHRDTGDYGRALADYAAAIEIQQRAGLDRLTFHMRKNIGQVYRLMGRHREAEALLAQLIATRSSAASMRHLWQAHMELASTYEALGDRPRAEAEFQKMLGVLEEQRNTSILDAFRTGSFAHALSAYDPYERYIRFLASGDAPRVAESLEVAERARARGFLEALASVRSSVAAKLPATLLNEESRIARGISTVQEQLRAADLPRMERERLLAELGRFEEQREKFILAMRVEHPSLAEARYPEIVGAAGVQRVLRPNETAVAFFLGEPTSFRWVMSRDQLRLQRLPGRAVIEKQAGRVRQALRAPTDLHGAKTETAALATLLFGDLAVDADRPLVIVPHGVLHYIPFEALPLGGAPIVQRHSVTYMPSLNSLVHLRRAPRSAGPFRVLAVGNPAMNGATASATRQGDVDNLSLLGALPFAERELHAIGRALPDRTQIMSGASARESGVRGQPLDRFPVIHFATHGLVSDAHPKRSGLLLSPEEGEDGLLQMGEIYGMGLRADLVVLSACQTALGREITGEGIVGLTRAFFYAGARSVVSALWNLNDRFAADFVERFYQEIGAGHSPEEALRRTKVAYVDHPQYSHPFYWSSLVITGDGTQPLVSEPIGEPIGLKLLAIGLALTSLLIVAHRVRRARAANEAL
jgi:CHAT domain-containing protein/tetratricopeptide (TPR) repeat protein